MAFFVIPAKAGIQQTQSLIKVLDPVFQRVTTFYETTNAPENNPTTQLRKTYEVFSFGAIDTPDDF
jgi:hypothetical protein